VPSSQQANNLKNYQTNWQFNYEES